ncbi:MAG: apolipoprotein N-acyltransferase [Myxococcales bacterium 68-20]|nr:MAG: apolipoprotein N-acyltransferase [Myxococcales bacterium 68-20]
MTAEAQKDAAPHDESADAGAEKKASTRGSDETPRAGGPLVRGRLAELGAIVSGVLYFVAFAGIDIWPLTFVCLVPLYVSLAGQTPKRATWLGFLTGLAMNLGGFYWLVEMLKTFSGFPTALCLLFTLIVSAYQGGRLALMGWLYGRATVRGWPAPIVFGAAFVASELAFPVLFPWYYAATVHKVPVLMQLAEIGGPILVGLVLVAVNLAIAEPLRAKLAASRELGARTVSGASSEERHSLAIDRRVVGAGVIALVFAVLYGAVRISMVNARVEKAEQVRVGYVQGNMGLMAKRQDPGEGLRRHRRMTAELRDKGVDLVVWSETSATAPAREDLAMKGNYYRDRFAASLGVPTIFGAVLYRVDPDRERWFNTAISTDVKGEFRGRYDKQYLLAFGEYLPFGDTFPILYKWSPHSGRFSAGTSLEPLIVDIKGTEHKVSALICYEDILPGFTNRAVGHADPELIVNMTNDAWFGDTTEPWQHLALAKFRAIEHRRFLVRSTNSGVSAIIDPNGAIVEGTLSTPFQAEARDAVIRWMKGGTVYEVLGDIPWYAVTLGIAIAAFRRRRPQAA